MASKSFVHFTRSLVRSAEVCCADTTLKACQNVNLDTKLLETGEDLSINGIELKFSNRVPPHGFTYKSSNGDEAVISYNPSTGNIFGSLKTTDGRSFAIEKCSSGQIWKEFDTATFDAKEDKAIKLDLPEKKKGLKEAHSAQDNQTVINYTLMVYYTPEFAAATDDIPGFIDQAIAETNQGYLNSEIPLTVSLFCLEAATINDIADTSTFISTFSQMKGTVSDLRNTADAAVLMALNFNSCGVGYLAQASSGWTVSITSKHCALGYYTFAHEIGHNFGCHHNPEEAANTYFSYGHAYLIPAGTDSQGRRTILSYSASGHTTRVNYYSNPAVIYPGTGTATGQAPLSNNAAVITENRFDFAGLGDESGSCDGVTASPGPVTTASPGASSSPSSGSCGNCVFPFLYGGRQHDTCTTIDGDNPWCATQVDSSGNFVNGAWEYCQDASCPGTSVTTTPQMTVSPGNEVGSCCK